MAVFVLDKQKRPLMPCTEKRARLLLERGRAVVVRLAPFTIRLKDRIGGETQPLRLKLDPGSKTTGMALVRDVERINPDTGEVCRDAPVLWLAEL
ncbi:RRXRR domain-containing protein, partial [Rhabdochromatium marinum]|uniref:RRXRR domain-containing protein n=1 Tax=Rhabdochromatium marinum TaxID=48729 RepID=UPI00190610D0